MSDSAKEDQSKPAPSPASHAALKLKLCPFCGKDEAAFGKTTYTDFSMITQLNCQHEFHFANCPWCCSARVTIRRSIW